MIETRDSNPYSFFKCCFSESYYYTYGYYCCYNDFDRCCFPITRVDYFDDDFRFGIYIVSPFLFAARDLDVVARVKFEDVIAVAAA